MDPLTLASLGLQATGKIVDLAGQNYRDKRNHAWDVQAATTAFNRQRALLADQRSYESPAAQMQRYIDAGLNPNLIYGQQQGSIAPPSVPQSSNSVGTTQTSFGDLNLLQQELMQAQIERLNTQNSNDSKLTDAKVKEIYGDTPTSKANIEYLLSSAASAIANADYTVKSLDNLSAEFNKLKAEEQEVVLRNAFTERTFESNVKRLEAQLECDQATAKNIQRTIDASIKQMLANSSNSYAQASLARSQEHLNSKELEVKDALIAYYDAVKKNKDAETAYVNVQKALDKAYGGAIRAGQILNATQLTVYDDGVRHTINKVSDRRAIEQRYQPKFE